MRERTDLADFSSVYYEETGFDHAQELMEPYLKKMSVGGGGGEIMDVGMSLSRPH